MNGKKRWREENKVECREVKERWRENNKAKSVASSQKYRQQHREACNEASRRYYQERKEQYRKTKKKWRENDKDIMQVYERRRRQRYLEACEEEVRKRREKQCEAMRKGRANNPEKAAASARKHYQKGKETILNRRREQYHQERIVDKVVHGKSPSKDPECHCGVCLACGGWAVSWKPTWYARLNAWLTSLTKEPGSEEVDAQRVDRGDDLSIIESEVETSSPVSTSEVDSKWGDRLETLLADESDSKVEMGPATAPTRRSARIATKPPISYQESVDDPMLEILERKRRLHSEATDQIVTRWELMWARSRRVNAILEDMAPIDLTHELDRFHAQLERENVPMDITVDDELFAFISDQL